MDVDTLSLMKGGEYKWLLELERIYLNLSEV